MTVYLNHCSPLYLLTVVGIDDRSTDNTYDIISSYAEKYDNVKVIRHEKNLNLGGGVNTAFTAFQKECSEGDLCVLMDGDELAMMENGSLRGQGKEGSYSGLLLHRLEYPLPDS